MKRQYAYALVVAFCAACTSVKKDVSASKGAEASAASVAAPAPLNAHELPTTSGALALDNLSAEIKGYRSAIAKAPSLDRMVALEADLQARGQYLGKLADYEESASVADAAVAQFGADGQAFAARARARAVYHRFNDALSDLDHAQSLGVKDAALRGTRASIFQALGRYPEALAIFHSMSLEKPELSALGSEASAYSEMGDTVAAEKLFVAAQYQYRDVSPFPVAWLWLQQGKMWEKRGQLARARTLYEAAIARVPGYAQAVAHLAGLAPAGQSIALLRDLSKTSDDPEYQAQLAVLLRENGEATESEQLLAAARQSYDTLTARHPEGFADHAARFWLNAGADPKKALTFSRQFAEARPSADSLALLVDAALAARDTATACSTAERALKESNISTSTHLLAARAYDSCGRTDQAKRERDLASAAP